MSRALPGGLALAVLLALAPVPALDAQQAYTSGAVLRATATDTLPLAGAEVVLHRIGRDSQGPVDTVLADGQGRFRFRFRPDTAAIFLLSANFAGIEYFSTAIHMNPAAPDTGLILLVSDTSSTAAVTTLSRHIVISRPDDAGRRPALEIVVLENAGPLTRIAADTTRPTWAAALPAGAVGAQAGSGDYSPDALAFRNDSVLLFAPVAPGSKQVVYTYSFPPSPGTVKLRLGDSVGTMNVLLEEQAVAVAGAGLTSGGTQEIEGKVFHQWVGAVAPGAVVTLAFGGSAGDWVLPVLVGLVALALLALTVRAFRARQGTPAAAGRRPVLEELAQLDRRYAGREADTPAAEWATYQARRAELKARLAGQLAAKEPVS